MPDDFQLAPPDGAESPHRKPPKYIYVVVPLGVKGLARKASLLIWPETGVIEVTENRRGAVTRKLELGEWIKSQIAKENGIAKR